MGLPITISVVRNNLHSFQKLAIYAYPIVQKSFKSNIRLDVDLDDVADYISRGKTAVKNPSRSLLYLEDLIKDYHKSENYSKLLSSTEEYKNFGPKKEFFIALALPSMTGKTQMAFNIRSKRPLYFALQASQMVNRYFSLISTKLMNMLESDFDEARKKVKSKIIYKGSLESEVEIESFKNKAII
jgi:hypothetical protein